MTQITRSPRRLAAAFLLASLTAACGGGSDKDKDQYVERPVGTIYNAAMDALLDRNYTAAAKQFDEVERQHPYSVWATKAQLMSAYSYYEAEKYDDAIVAIDRFIQLHPSNPDAPYAYYLKALCYYEQIADVGRDQRNTRQALSALEELTRRYPESAYARDAQLKIDLTRDHLAGKEMSVGRFYLREGQVLAAINRFKAVVDRYQTTSHVPEALHRLVEAYTTLGMKTEATQVAAVLGYNYPGSEWYADTYAVAKNEPLPNKDGDSQGFFSRLISPPVKLGSNVDTSPETAKRRAEEKAERDAVLAKEQADDAAKGTKTAAVTPPPVAPLREQTPGERRAVDVAPVGSGSSLRAPMPPNASLTGNGPGFGSGAPSFGGSGTASDTAPAAGDSNAPVVGNAYAEAMRKAEEERQRAQDSLAYWTSASAQAADPATKAQAEQTKAGAQKAVDYWTARQKALQDGAAAAQAGSSAPANSDSATPPSDKKEGGGWLSRTWKSVF